MALTLSRSVSTTATSRAARSSRARATIKPMAFHYDTRRNRACRPSMTPYRSPLIAGLGFMGSMLASEWLTKSLQQQSPSVDIATSEAEYTLSADCPGMGKEDINIEISPENVLTISGSRKATSAARKARSPYAAAPFSPPTATATSSWPQPAADAESPEDAQQRIKDDDGQSNSRSSGSTASRVAYSFRRSFMLPEDVDVDGVKAQLDKGVLTLTLPRRVVPKPPTKRVSISSTKPDGGSGASSDSDTKNDLWA